jgi:molecular chaperone HscB
MAVLEVQERLEEGDVSHEELGEMKRVNAARVVETERRLGNLIERGFWEQARAEAIRLKYWMNVKEGLDHWEPGKGGIVLIH